MQIGMLDDVKVVRMSDEEQLRQLCERHDTTLRDIEWREAVLA